VEAAWIKKMWYLCTMAYSAMKNNKAMPSSGKWMELESIRASEISQVQKDKYVFSHM
jgi:hypothetical protein